MKIVILGAGRRGIRLARHLVEEKKDVVIIDEDPSDVNRAMSSVDCLGVVGSGTDTEDLRQAGVKNADAFIALTGSDETNLVSCGMVSSQFKVPLTIASVRNLSYTNTGAEVGKSPVQGTLFPAEKEAEGSNIMGITHIVNPHQETARYIYHDIDRGVYSDIITFDDSSLVLYNVFVEKYSKYAGKKVKNIRRSVPGNFIIAALNRSGEALVPSGDTVIMPGDTLSLVAREDSVESILGSVGRRRQKPKRIAVVGAAKVTDFLLKQFPRGQRRQFTVIAKDTAACDALATKYPEVLVLNENITNEGVFRQENLDSYDLLLSLTDNDELNIIVASYAKHFGVKNSMALLNRNQDFIRMANHLDIDSLISSQDVTVDSIARYLQGSNISSTHSLFDGKLEAFEYKVRQDSPLNGTTLMDINMKGKGIIAGAHKENGETVIPGGTYRIEAGDTLVLVIERRSIDFIHRLLNTEA